MRRLLTSLLLLLALGAAAPASASVPSPANSTVPPCLVTCPMGDIPFAVTIRDLANNPIVGASVVLDFSQCPGAYLCQRIGGYGYGQDPVAHTITFTTGVGGFGNVGLHVGGSCGAGSVKLFVNGVFFRNYVLASVDLDGNGEVGTILGNDNALFAAKLGTADPSADYDCSGGTVDAQDQLFFNQHAAHGCDAFIDPIERHSWGRLKAHYR